MEWEDRLRALAVKHGVEFSKGEHAYRFSLTVQGVEFESLVQHAEPAHAEAWLAHFDWLLGRAVGLYG